jgi:hypothetical protein
VNIPWSSVLSLCGFCTDTKVSEEKAASIFRVEIKSSNFIQYFEGAVDEMLVIFKGN